VVTNGPDGCGRAMGSGNGFWGTLNIEKSDDASVTVMLSGSGGSGHPPANGHYVASRCGAPPVAPETPAVAFHGTNLPAAGPASPDPASIYVVLDTGPASCTDPWSNSACNGASRITLTLPPSLQQKGTFALFDPAIDASYTISVKDSSGNCTTDTGAFTP